MTADPDVVEARRRGGCGLVRPDPSSLPTPASHRRGRPGRRGVDPRLAQRSRRFGRPTRAGPTCRGASRGWSWRRHRSATSAGRRASTTTASTRRPTSPSAVRSRTSGSCFSTASSPTAPRRAIRRRGGRCRELPEGLAGLLPDARDGRKSRSTSSAPRCRCSEPSSVGDPSVDLGPEELRGPGAPARCRDADPAGLPRRLRARKPARPAPCRPLLRRQLSLDARPVRGARRPRARHRAVPGAHRRPRLQRVHLHRTGHHFDRRRPGRGRSAVRSARSPALCTEGPRAGRSTCSTASAPRTVPRRGSATRSPEGTGSWVSATASTRPRTRVPHSSGRRRVRWEGPLVDFAEQVEHTTVDVLAELKPGRQLYTNVEFFAGVVMHTSGIPREHVHPDLRHQPHHRLDGPCPRAGCRQPFDPPGRTLRRTTASTAGARPLRLPVLANIEARGQGRGPIWRTGRSAIQSRCRTRRAIRHPSLVRR